MIKKRTKVALAILSILFGIFFIVFGGYDDSPGAQFIGLIATGFGIAVLIKTRTKNVR